nr:putative transposase [Novosphingobium sp. KA1]
MAAHPEPPVGPGAEAGYDELPDDVEQLKAMLLAERARTARLEHILKLINRTTFGKRSEKLSADQLALALEDQAVALGEAQGLQDKTDEETERYGLRPRKRRPAGAERASLPAHLPRFEVVIEPDNLECACGGALHRIGEDRCERLDIIPAQHRVMVTIRPRYACRCCTDGVHQASAPAHVVPGGLPTEALIANVLINKYCDHLPLYRQSKIFARQGIEISRATLANWVGRGIAALMPIVNRMRVDALVRSRLFVDETTVKVLAPGTGKTKTGYMWVIVCDDRAHGGADPPLALYTYLPGRGKMWAKQLLGTYQGILQVDAWQAYDQFGKDVSANAGVEKSYCWAHLRRKFMDAGSDAPIAQDALQRIARIYSIEKEVRGYPAEERLAVRQERSRPLVDKLHAWFVATSPRIMAGSATSDAMKYALKRWGGFTRFLYDGRIELDNNSAERAIRPVTLQRKNALFAGHQLGAENWAAIASLVETCKMLDIEPYAYLSDALSRIITRSDTDPIDDLLPYNWIDTHAGQTMFEMSNIATAA